LIERELKREKLVAKYAAKHAELKAIANDAKKSDEERAAARLGLQGFRVTPIRPVSATVASPVVRALLPSIRLARQIANYSSMATSQVSPRPAGKPGRSKQHEHSDPLPTC
jgi:hypothetical protein